MKLNLKLKIIFSFLLFVSAFAKASTAPKCSAVLMFQKQEVEAKVTAIVKTILTYQMNSANGLQINNAGFIEATRQINEIVANFPEMLGFYNAEMARLSKKDSAARREVKRQVEKESALDQVSKIEDSVVILEIDDEPHFIFKRKNGTYFVIGENKDFVDFFTHLKEIQQVISNKNRSALSILHKDGSVLTWGYYASGGDSSHLDLKNVHSIYSTANAFAALKNDGSVVTWGNKQNGGDSSQIDLTNVKSIYSNGYAFAALKSDDTVVTWGDKNYGGNSSHLDLTNVKVISSTSLALAALKHDGSVFTWGDKVFGGDSSHLDLTNVISIYSTVSSFAALKNNGSVVTWGDKDSGGDSSHLDLTNVISIYSTKYAFAAIKNDGSVVSWGDKYNCGNASNLDLTNIKSIYSTSNAFAALKKDGSVVTWGQHESGGDSSVVQNHLYDIVHIIEVKSGSFLALRKDGKYVLWGKPIGQFQNQVLDFDLM